MSGYHDYKLKLIMNLKNICSFSTHIFITILDILIKKTKYVANALLAPPSKCFAYVSVAY